jgi:hypothetical protein
MISKNISKQERKGIRSALNVNNLLSISESEFINKCEDLIKDMFG